MFNINDSVMYGSTGVCKIVDIRRENFNAGEKLYYVLSPVGDAKTTIYCPADADNAKIRCLLSREEILAIIDAIPDAQSEWIENDRLRAEAFRDIVRRGDHMELVQMLKILYGNREEKEKDGKKFHAADERVMTEAENILHGEFAHVLGIELEEVAPFITRELNKKTDE